MPEPHSLVDIRVEVVEIKVDIDHALHLSEPKHQHQNARFADSPRRYPSHSPNRPRLPLARSCAWPRRREQQEALGWMAWEAICVVGKRGDNRTLCSKLALVLWKK